MKKGAVGKPASWQKPKTEFTPERQERFLEHLRASGMKYLSAEAAGVCYNTVKRFAKNNPEFAEAHDLALQARIDELERAALSRAIDGVVEPVIGGKDRDQVVATIRRYSDSLASKILSAKREEYRDKVSADINITGGVLAIPGRGLTAEQWEKEHGEAAKGARGEQDE